VNGRGGDGSFVDCACGRDFTQAQLLGIGLFSEANRGREFHLDCGYLKPVYEGTVGAAEVGVDPGPNCLHELQFTMFSRNRLVVDRDEGIGGATNCDQLIFSKCQRDTAILDFNLVHANPVRNKPIQFRLVVKTPRIQ